MRITINLASKPFADLGPALRQLRILIGVFVVLIIGLGIGLHFFHEAAEKVRAKERTLDTQIAKLTAEHKGYETMMAEHDNKLVLDQSRALNTLFAEKNFSWTLAMEDLETVLPGGVQVTTLEPDRDPKTSDITVKLRVLGPRDRSIDLVKNLEHSKRFQEARIVGESQETGSNQNDRALPVTASTKANFDLLAQYILPTEDEMKSIAKKQKKEVVSAPVVVRPMTSPRPVQPTPMVNQNLEMQQPQGRFPGRPGQPQPFSNRPNAPRHLPPGYDPNNQQQPNQLPPPPRPIFRSPLIPSGDQNQQQNTPPAQTPPGGPQ
jgi:type IV pilus assembly protein PilN